jgi:hypothetical protein
MEKRPNYPFGSIVFRNEYQARFNLYFFDITTKAAVVARIRCEARELREYLRSCNVPDKDIAEAIPLIVRKLLEFERDISGLFLQRIIPLAVLLFVPIMLYSLLIDNILEQPIMSSKIILISYALYLIPTSLLWNWCFKRFIFNSKIVTRIFNYYHPRFIKLKHQTTNNSKLFDTSWPKTNGGVWQFRLKNTLAVEKLILKSSRFWWSVIFMSLLIAIPLVLVPNYNNLGFPVLSSREITFAAALASSALIWTLTISYVILLVYTRFFLTPRVIDIVILRTLVDAFKSISCHKHHMGNIAYRAGVAADICSAAHLFESQMVRLFVRGDKAAEAGVRPMFSAAAAWLRERLATLAVPKGEARCELSRSLGQALVGVARGDFAFLGELKDYSPATAPLTWRDRLLSFSKWTAVALGPSICVAILWRVPEIPDATKAVAIQFAAACFVVATFSALDPQGREKLGSVVSTGSALFGWGKPKE